MTIAENLHAVRLQMAAACAAAGRDAGSVTLVAVSKTRALSDVMEAHAAGQRDFGENYAQEFRDKVDAAVLAGTAGTDGALTWHFIGALQSNKAKYVAPRAALVHDVDRIELATELGKRARIAHWTGSDAGAARLGVLLGVNIGEEPQKSGVMPGAALALAAEVTKIHGIVLRGLMCIPPADADPRPHFERLRALRDEGLRVGLPLHELSMGMSHDYDGAIACGATIVRVGTAIFGARAPAPRS
ncbi:MAG: YggS family pyridoxal phosphate-dependent enzyme [Myxococcales bacterium]|nr:YggS family pyridoxal phosphate-dependent enzyme [Myxococcales bacterium]